MYEPKKGGLLKGITREEETGVSRILAMALDAVGSSLEDLVEALNDLDKDLAYVLRGDRDRRFSE